MKRIARSITSGVCILVLAAGIASAAVTVNSASALSSTDARTAESSLGDLVADAIRASQNADAAFVCASELKETEIPKGKVSSHDVTQAVAYPDDPVVVVRLSGGQIKQALERSVSIYDQKNLGFLQVSGIKFSFKKTGGDRVGSVTVKGEPLDGSKNYKVAMSNSLANGALGYWRIWKKDQVVTVSQDTVPQAVDKYLKDKDSIDYSKLNRITVAK